MYKELKKVIDEIQIVDPHCHVGIALAGELQECEEAERLPFKDPFCLPKDSKTNRLDWQEQLHYEAYEKIYGFTREMLDDPSCFEKMEKTYLEQRREHTVELVDKIFDLSGIEYAIGNMAIPEILKGHPRIGFIPRIDPLLYPFDNKAICEVRDTAGAHSLVRQFEWELKQLRKRVKLEDIPNTFDEYLSFVDRVIEHYEQEGVKGYKIFSARVRSTYFPKEDPKEAQNDYAKARGGDLESYLRFQNRVIWHMMEHAAKESIPVQLHMAPVDAWIEATNPLNLLTFLQDKKTENLNLVVLHGGYPRYNETAALALSAGAYAVSNVHIDISGRIMFSGHPKTIADMIYNWLVYPQLWDKITYGSDMIYGERFFYTCSKTGRKAVYMALERLINDEIVSEETAIGIAKNILRNTAIRLYKLNLPLA